MRTTGDQILIKKINKSIVLETIRRQSPLSRAQLSSLTGLHKATVSSLVHELMDSHLVYEIGTGPSSGGRKPVMLLFNRAAGYSIGIDLGVNYILTVLTDLEGKIIRESHSPLKEQSLDYVLKQLMEAIRSMIQAAPESPYGIIGIGIGVPGIVGDHSTLVMAPNLDWREVDLLTPIKAEFGLPVSIDNEANAGAVGEKYFGAGRSVSDMLYISIGIGIGSGMIINGELFRGFSGSSGEIGHMSIQATGPKCKCGNQGCWELYASEQALLKQASALLGEDTFRLDMQGIHQLDTLIELAQQGHKGIIQLFSELGEAIGTGINNLINIVNPELVIIGNRMILAESWIKPSMLQTIENRSLLYFRNGTQVKFSDLGNYSAVLGAAHFAIAHFFSNTRVTVE